MPTKSFNTATLEAEIAASSPEHCRYQERATGGLPEVACVMLSRGLGGLEQSMLDYCEALTIRGHRVSAVVHPDWPGVGELRQFGVTCAGCTSLGDWDPIAAFRLRRVIDRFAPSVVVTIGRRASGLVHRALGRTGDPPQVGQTPNYGFKHLIGLEHVIATTPDIARALVAAGQPEARISIVPNMIRVPQDAAPPPAAHGPVPVIGALGRFVAKKGFADFLDALALLRDRGHRFEAVLAGSGPQEKALRARAERAGLGDRLRFPGWVTDKEPFFGGIDVFCVPSLHEPFGIVVLEGFAHGRATVVADAEGPRQIASDGVDGLVVPRGEPERLAEALALLVEQPEERRRLGDAARATVRERYELSVVAPQLSAVLCAVVSAASSARSAADARSSPQ